MQNMLNKTHNTSRNIACLLGLICLIATGAASAKLYRWVDAEGNVHYSDKVPAEHSKRARKEFSKEGIVVKETGRAKTAEEIAKDKEMTRLRIEQQKLIDLQRAKDRVLVRTFKTEDDILMARNGKLVAINAHIQITRVNIRRLKEKLAGMQKSAASLERQGSTISRNLLKDIEQSRKQLKDSYASIIRKEQEKEAIRQKYAADLDRFRALKNLAIKEEKSLSRKDIYSLLDTVVPCEDRVSCDNAWGRAEDYVRKHATTRLQMLSDVIVMTGIPIKDDDISITASRIPRKGQPNAADLFMDLQCKSTPRGIDLCKTEAVKSIRSGFRGFLTSAQ